MAYSSNKKRFEKEGQELSRKGWPYSGISFDGAYDIEELDDITDALQNVLPRASQLASQQAFSDTLAEVFFGTEPTEADGIIAGAMVDGLWHGEIKYEWFQAKYENLTPEMIDLWNKWGTKNNLPPLGLMAQIAYVENTTLSEKDGPMSAKARGFGQFLKKTWAAQMTALGWSGPEYDWVTASKYAKYAIPAQATYMGALHRNVLAVKEDDDLYYTLLGYLMGGGNSVKMLKALAIDATDRAVDSINNWYWGNISSTNKFYGRGTKGVAFYPNKAIDGWRALSTLIPAEVKSSATGGGHAGTGEENVHGNAIAAEALKHEGKKYVWGAQGPNTFDCSGLVVYCAKIALSLAVIHYSVTQSTSGVFVDKGAVQRGDLVFFGNPVHHVGIYLGNDVYIHAPRTGDVVKQSKFSARKDYATARRLWKTIPVKEGPEKKDSPSKDKVIDKSDPKDIGK